MCWISRREPVHMYVNWINFVRLLIRQHMNVLKILKENIPSVEDRCVSPVKARKAPNRRPHRFAS